jgi:single-strand DNA-binding protein
MNKLTIIGNLTAAPEERTIPSGKTVTTFTVAVSRKADRDKTDFFRCSAWGKTGEVCGRYLDKGRKVCVVGEVSARAYTDKQGEPKASLEVFVTEVEFLSPAERRDNPGADHALRDIDRQQAEFAARRETAVDGEFTEITDGDLPF